MMGGASVGGEAVRESIDYATRHFARLSVEDWFIDVGSGLLVNRDLNFRCVLAACCPGSTFFGS